VLAKGLAVNQVATGLALTILGVGLSGLIGAGFVGERITPAPHLRIPGLTDIPLLGRVVFGEDGPTIQRVAHNSLVPVFTLVKRVNGEFFWLTYFAFGPGGTTYADEIPGGQAFEAQQQLVSVKDSHVGLLWQQGSAAAK